MRNLSKELTEYLKGITYSDEEFYNDCRVNELIINDRKKFGNDFVKSYMRILTNNLETLAV